MKNQRKRRRRTRTPRNSKSINAVYACGIALTLLRELLAWIRTFFHNL